MDIEDVDPNAFQSRNESTDGVVRARYRVKNANRMNASLTECDTSDCIPDVFKVFVQTWGCTHNTSDSEYMAGLLSQYGYQVHLGGSHKPDLPEVAGSADVANGSCDCSEPSGSDCSGCGSQSTDEMARQAADVWVLNSCTVKGPAEDHFRNAVLAGIKLGKRIVVAGCVPQGRPDADYLKGVSVIGVQQIDRVVEVVEETLRGNTVRFLEKKWASPSPGSRAQRLGGAALDLPKIRRNPLIEILAVSTGCLNACTYCKTKHARGVLASYPIDQLLDRAKQAFEEGVKELWLTSEDLGAYGRDLPRSASPLSCPTVAARFPDHLTLSDLLAGLVRLIPPGCMLRLGMTNPPYILDQLQVIAEVLSHPRVYSFIHIPVQSGSDAVLDRMKREYTVDEFCEVVDYLHTHVRSHPCTASKPPDCPSSNHQESSGSLTVATDIICGFPNESDQDFDKTVELVERFQFPVLYINQFFARPGTPAASMPRKATTAEVKKRTKRLHDLFRSYTPYADRLGSEVRVLVTEVSTDGRFWVGHTKAYEQVLLPKLPELYGRIVLVRIVECGKFFMRADLVDAGPFDTLVCLDQDATSWPLPSLAMLEPQLPVVAGTQSLETMLPSPPTHNSKWVFGICLTLVMSYMMFKVIEYRGLPHLRAPR